MHTNSKIRPQEGHCAYDYALSINEKVVHQQRHRERWPKTPRLPARKMRRQRPTKKEIAVTANVDKTNAPSKTKTNEQEIAVAANTGGSAKNPGPTDAEKIAVIEAWLDKGSTANITTAATTVLLPISRACGASSRKSPKERQPILLGTHGGMLVLLPHHFDLWKELILFECIASLSRR